MDAAALDRVFEPPRLLLAYHGPFTEAAPSASSASYDRTVVQVRTDKLLEAFEDAVELSPINSGATFPPGPVPRVEFSSLNSYPFDYWGRKRGSESKAVVEVTVLDAMNKPDLLNLYQA